MSSTIQWFKSVVGMFSFSRRLLAWDSFEAHMTAEVRATLKSANTEDVIVPGGCTKYVQAPDVVCNKPFKAFIANKYDEWLAAGVHEYTEAGNLKPVPRRKIVEWVIESWDSLPKEMVTNSFKSWALTLPTDGSQDDYIHYLKNGQPCESGRGMLREQMNLLRDPSFNGSINPFANITDSDVEDANDPQNVIDADRDCID